MGSVNIRLQQENRYFLTAVAVYPISDGALFFCIILTLISLLNYMHNLSASIFLDAYHFSLTQDYTLNTRYYLMHSLLVIKILYTKYNDILNYYNYLFI